jgi:hypothetical protein
MTFGNSYAIARSKRLEGAWARPVPVPITAELKHYVSGLDPEQETLIFGRFNQNRQDKMRQNLGLGDFKFMVFKKVLSVLRSKSTLI